MGVTDILDWIFEGIANWVASVMTGIMDAISGIFLGALGTDMTAMEEYFPFVTKAFAIMQYTAWALLFLITVWQLFRAFGGPITEAENPLHLIIRSALFAFLIGFAKPIFGIALDIARAPYTALMDASMNPGDFTFAGIQQNLANGLVSLVAVASVVGLLLIIIMMIALAWNYFKLLLETVERYIVVGVLCYTAPLAFAVGGSKATNKVFQSWCKMVGSQLLLLVMNVWFLRAFNSSVGTYAANGGALSTGSGNIFLWLFCALAFLKTAQRFDSYLASLGLTVAQTGSSMGMEMLMALRVLGGFGGGFKNASSVFRGASGSASGAAGSAAAGGFMASLASKFKGNSYVRDAVTDGGGRLGAGGSVGLVGRLFGGMAARNGAALSGDSIASVASRSAAVSGSIAGEIADRSLTNYMPHLAAVGTAANADGTTAALTDGGINIPERAPGPGSIPGAEGSYSRSGVEELGRPDLDGLHPTPASAGTEVGTPPVSVSDTGVPTDIATDGDFVTGEYSDMDISGDGIIPPSTSESSPGYAESGYEDVAALHDDASDYKADSADGFSPGIYEPDTAADPATRAGISGYNAYDSIPGEVSYSNTQISGGHISTTAATPDGKEAAVDLYSASQFDKPSGPYSVVSASDGSKWYQVASGDGMGAFYSAPYFTGSASEAPLVAATFPSAPEGTMLRTVGDGVIEASHSGDIGGQGMEHPASLGSGNSLWYNSAHYQEPDAPHDNIRTSDGVGWYAMRPRASVPDFETGSSPGGIGDMPGRGTTGSASGSDSGGMSGAMAEYNRAQFRDFMPGYEQTISSVDASRGKDGLIEVRNPDGSGTAFYDKTVYQAPRGDHQVYEDKRGGQWYAISGTPTVERRPVFENGKPVYEGDTLKTTNVESVKYKSTPNKFDAPKKRDVNDRKPPNPKKR